MCHSSDGIACSTFGEDCEICAMLANMIQVTACSEARMRVEASRYLDLAVHLNQRIRGRTQAGA